MKFSLGDILLVMCKYPDHSRGLPRLSVLE
jgi:hypothetical protein